MPRVSIEVRGKTSSWDVSWDAPQSQIDGMREDGIDVGIIMNTMPEWVVVLGYWPARTWCFFQDIWNLKNPFSKGNSDV